MTGKIPKTLIYQILFALCVIVPYYNVYELTFIIWSITALITLKSKYSLTLVRYVLCFAGIVLIAFIVAFFKDYKTYNYIRDFTYLVKPIIGLLVGYQLCRSQNIKPFHTIIYTGLALAVLHLGTILFSVVIYKIVNIHVLRMHAGYFSDFEIYAFLIIIFNRQFDVPLSPLLKRTLLLVIGISAALYVSRTNFIQFGVLYMGMKGYLAINKRSVTILSILALLSAIFYMFLLNMSLSRNGRGIEALLFKIRNAPIEAFKTKINENDYRDFNDNYRSFENITTYQQVKNEGTAAILFGKGMGATIDAGREVWSNDQEFIRYMPTLHNGFMTVFLKSGLVGVALNLLFIYLLFKQSKYNHPLIKQINLLLSGSAIFLIIASWVLLGLYLKIENKAILLGFLLAYKEIIIRDVYIKNNG